MTSFKFCVDLILRLPNIYNGSYKTMFYKAIVEVSSSRHVNNDQGKKANAPSKSIIHKKGNR